MYTEEPKRTLLTIGNVKRVTSIWPNGSEMVEEFDVSSNALISLFLFILLTLARRVKGISSPLTGEAPVCLFLFTFIFSGFGKLDNLP